MFPAFVQASADYAANRDSTTEDIIQLTNDLAALVAAVAIVPNRPGRPATSKCNVPPGLPLSNLVCVGGLAPTVRSSDGKARLGHISRRNR